MSPDSSRRCLCPESAYKVACVVTTLALVPDHACHWRADVCRDTQHNAHVFINRRTCVYCLLTLVPMCCMHVVLFLYWHKCSEGFSVVLPLCAFMWTCCTYIPCPVCVFGWISPCLLFTHWTWTVRFYMSSTYPNWQQAACCGILMLSSCMHKSLMFSSHSWFWSCSRAQGGNTAIQMNRLWNSLVRDEAA